MEAPHKEHRPLITVGKDAEEDIISTEVQYVEPLFYDHPQNQIGVVVKQGWSSTRGLIIL